MRKGDEDAGGPSQGTPADPGGADLQEMKDQFEQQQLLITQLKEIMKKTDQSASSVTQEKVAEYANTLTKMKSRAKRHSLAAREGEEVTRLNTPASEKVLLLRQQLEQNKAKLAERGKSQKGIEEMVAQVRAQLDDSQQQINLSQTPLNISLFEDRVDYTPQLSSQELYNILLNKDKRINEMNLKMSKLQANVLDLQENLKEKDSVIDARTKAITLMSENLSKKGKSTLDALEDTKEQMRRMQENFIEIEEQLKAENATIRNELADKSIQVQRLQAENQELTLRNSELEKSESVLNAKITELETSKSSPASSPSRRSPSKSRKGKKGKFPSKSEDNNDKLITDLEKQLEEKDKQVELRNSDIQTLKQQHEVKLAEYETTIKELQSKQEELEKMSQELSAQKETVVKVAKVEVVPDIDTAVDSELAKLKQQLDEANKNMIKVKAQHKSKLKEMTKKIDAFKKISNVNAELVKVENENAKLQLKIAELEEEKGQLQLGMVESKVSTSLDELEATIKDLTSKLDDSQSTINSMETETSRYKQEVQSLRERLEQMTNDEVKQELTTVQFEEQYDSLEKEKVMLQNMIETLEAQIVDFNAQMETLKKEKSEIQLKYDALLQENADLIDRLEKLSTEKVSSAESIEIVENLTQQEKLELEAYQKSLLPKTSLENLDENVDLNDSVNQLTEETSELLQKIELFTVERREVMEKLELLTEENNQLSLKLKEVENNRDVLVETYEQLQTEKEVLDTKLEEYEGQIAEYKKQDSVDHGGSDIEEYKKFAEVQRQEISDLQLKLLSYEKNSSSHKEESDKEKLELESKYMKLISSYEDLEHQVRQLEESNKNYDDIIAGNKEDLINYAKVLEENNTLKDSNKQLSQECETLLLTKQENEDSLQKVQSLLKEEQLKIRNLTDSVDDYEKELNENLEKIKLLDNDLHKLQEEKLCIENALAEKTAEIAIVHQEKHDKEVENERLLKSQQQDDKSDVEAKLSELQIKNNQQFEKMKKIAANLKKKTLDYKELEAKYQELSNKNVVDSQADKKEDKQRISSLEAELAAASEELQKVKKDYEEKGKEVLELLEQQRNLQLESSQIKTRNEEITTQLHTYSAQIEDLQNMIREYESQLGALNRELESIRASGIQNEEKDDVIRRLNEEIEALKYNSQTSNNALQLKIHEQEICIESQDQELHKYKEKAAKLEEGLSEVEARRYSLEQRTIELGKNLESKESSFIEATEKEEELECRLKALAEKDFTIEQTLLETQEENSALQIENQKLMVEVEVYKKQVNTYNLRLKEFEEKEELINTMESQRQELEVRSKTLENEIRKLQHDLGALRTETDKSENELQAQLECCAHERKQLMEQLEMSGEEIAALVQTRKEFQVTIEDLNNKLDQQQNEFEVTINKYSDLQQEHKKSLSQLEDFEKLVRIQEEKIQEFTLRETETPEYLKQLLTSKLGELEEFRRNYVPSPADFFSENTTEQRITQEIKVLEEKLNQSQLKHGGGHLAKIQELEYELGQRVESLKMNEALLQKLQADLAQKDEEIKQTLVNITEGREQLDFARNMLEQVEANNFETLNRNNVLEQKLQEIQKEKEELQQKILRLEVPAQSQQEPKLQWPDTSDDPFAFVQDQKVVEDVMIQSHAVPFQATNEPGNNQEELLQKIRTLEFMLYNVEQEKQNSMIQCAQLSEELGRLIYEREQASKAIPSESQTSNVTTTDSQFNLESQIVLGDEISLPPQIPHEQSKDPQQCTSTANVVEEPCQQKHAYECNPSAFADDDGWGFDVEETKLEETHQSSVQSTNSRISELEEKIRLLTLDKDAASGELQQANIKSGKLIKKLKEFKVRNDQLLAKVKAKSSDDFGLDDAIQEELKAQISTLEKKLKETDAELSKERAEKETVAKRVDVLTAANERMVEMKEKQDIEMMGYQQQSRELQLKLEKVAWSSDFSEAVVSTSSNTNTSVVSELPMDNADDKLQELRETIKELTLDNEEMQAMLEEQTRLRKEAENRARSVPTDVVDQGQLQAALEEKHNLMSQITIHEGDKESLRKELEEMQAKYGKICEECDGVRDELRRVGEKLQENYKEKTLLEAAALENGIYIESLKKTIDDMQMQTNLCAADGGRLQNDVDVLQKEKERLGNLISRLEQKAEVICEELVVAKATIDDLRAERQQLQSANTTLETRLNDSLAKLEENQLQLTRMQSSSEGAEALAAEIAELRAEVTQIAELKQALLDQQGEYEAKLVANSEQLALEWAAHVDQRGNDVAESWKLHVDTRENEFAQLEAALRKELNDVEERCNALVNENNELRRNVDAEIRNEVDRISALQSHITQLSEGVQAKSSEVERLNSENSALNAKLHEYERRINDGSEQLARLIQQQEEKDRSIADLSAQLQLARDNKQSEELVDALRAELTAKDNEITHCRSTIDAMTQSIEELEKVRTQVADNQAQLNELGKEKEKCERLKSKLEEASLQVTTIQGTLQEKELRLQELETMLQQQQSQDSNLKMQLQTHVQELQQQIAQYVMQLQENNLHIGSLNDELESYKVLGSHVQSKDAEIQRLNGLLEEMNREQEYALENQLLESQSVLSSKTQEYDALRRLLNQTEIARDELVLVKDSEIEAYREQLENLNKQLGEYQIEYATAQNRLSELTTQIAAYEQQHALGQQQIAEYERQIGELNGIIEGQVLKIEELQDESFEKSRNYDALVAEMDDTRELQKKVHFAESSSEDQSPKSREEEQGEPVSRAELDLALYMLHQRDVRCEELTVELMQLLEERDTLQLRLSNAIREKEAIRSRMDQSVTSEVTGAPSEGGSPLAEQSTSGGKAKAILLGATGTEMATEAKEGQMEAGALANKLSELKVVGYKKDKTLVDEQEVRRIQQMAFIEQHKDAMARMPAEAQARLLDASYTLSRDVQSPSKVLLNWLWGKSTPKVNNV